MQTPLLSICIPTYNRAEYLEKSLDSLVNQENFSQIEVVISDNASTDATSDVCRKFTERYPNIFYTETRTTFTIEIFLRCCFNMKERDCFLKRQSQKCAGICCSHWPEVGLETLKKIKRRILVSKETS